MNKPTPFDVSRASDTLRAHLCAMVSTDGTLLVVSHSPAGASFWVQLQTLEVDTRGNIVPFMSLDYVAATANSLRFDPVKGIRLSRTGADIVTLLQRLANTAGTPIYFRTLAGSGGWQIPQGWDGVCLTEHQASGVVRDYPRDWQRTDVPLVLARVDRGRTCL